MIFSLTEGQVKRSSQQRTRLKRIFTLILVVIPLLIGAWWWASPRRMWYVGTFPSTYLNNNPDVLTSDAGFLLHDAEGFCLRDWRTGRIRWRISPATDDLRSTSPNRGCPTYAFSRNGRYFATVIHWKERFRVQTWCDGVLTGDLLLPSDMCLHADTTSCPLSIANTGRLYIMAGQIGHYFTLHPPPLNAAVVENGRLIARGTSRLLGDACFADFDMVCLKDDAARTTAMYAVDIRDGRMIFRKKFETDKTFELYPMTADAFMGYNGTVYTTPVAGHAPAAQDDGRWSLNRFGDVYCVSNPVRNREWTFTLVDRAENARAAETDENRCSYNTGAVSTNGQYALGVQEVMQPPQAVWAALAKTAPWTRAIIAPVGEGTYYQIYQRPANLHPITKADSRLTHNPGRLCARLFIPSVHTPKWPMTIATPNCPPVYLSPDGHAMLCGPIWSGMYKGTFTLYRW